MYTMMPYRNHRDMTARRTPSLFDDRFFRSFFDMNDEKAYYSERRVGHVSRSFNLEGIDQDKISADYKNGILYVTLPKQEPVKAPGARRIAIGRGTAEEPKEQ